MKQHLKAIVWPREPVGEGGAKCHRYIVVGVLVTSEPLAALEQQHDGITEVLLDGECNLAEALAAVPSRAPKFRVAGASNVLANLNDL